MRRPTIGLVALAMVLAGCGNSGEGLAERVIEAESGADVEIESDGDSITIESDDGSATIEIDEGEDGITITGTDDSGGDVTIEMGGTEVPDDFPMPVFEPGEVTHVASTDTAQGSSYSVTIEIDPDDAAPAVTFYADWFEGEGMTVTSSPTMVIGEGETVISIVQVSEYGSYSEVVLTWTPNS